METISPTETSYYASHTDEALQHIIDSYTDQSLAIAINSGADHPLSIEAMKIANAAWGALTARKVVK